MENINTDKVTCNAMHWTPVSRLSRHATCDTVCHDFLKYGCLSDLHSLQVVAVVTEDSGQLDPSDLSQLLQGEGRGPAAILIPEPVSVSEVVELLADETGQGGANHAAGQRPLRDAGRPQVDIFW